MEARISKAVEYKQPAGDGEGGRIGLFFKTLEFGNLCLCKYLIL